MVRSREVEPARHPNDLRQGATISGQLTRKSFLASVSHHAPSPLPAAVDGAMKAVKT